MRTAAKWLLPILFALVLLVPLWMFPHLPLVDYPNHLARAFVLAHLDDPAYGFQRYYAADWGPYPYLAMDVTLMALQRVLQVETAGRIFLSLSLLSLPVGFWFFLRQANPGHDLLAVWSLLFAYNYFFLTGLANLQLSAGLCFLALGLGLRLRERPAGWLWVVYPPVILMLYFSHLAGFAVNALILLILALRERRSARELAVCGLAMLPGALLLLTSRGGAPVPEMAYRHMMEVKGITPLFAIQSYSPRFDLATHLVLLLCLLAAWWKNPEFRWNRRWLEVCVILYVLYWIAPQDYGRATEADARLLLFLGLLLPAAARIGARMRYVAAALLLLFCLRMIHVAGHFASQQPFLEGQMQAIVHTEEGARVLPLVAWAGDRQASRSYSHFWAYGVIRKHWLTPYLFQDRGVHPLRVLSDAYVPPVRYYLPTLYEDPVQWPEIARDYDFVWAFHVPEFAPRLDALGTLVYENGDLKLYRVRSKGR